MEFNRHRLHKNILKRLSEINKSQDYLADKLNISRSTINRLGNNKDIKLDNYFKLLNWLGDPITKYITWN